MEHSEKQQLRSRMKETLRSFHVQELAQLSQQACMRVQNLLTYKQAQTILLYQALPYEADPALLIEHALKAGKRVAFPYCLPDFELDALEPHDPDCFEPGAFNIMTPVLERSNSIPPEELDFVLVPGLAFDMHGGRLGRGAGYYDRFLRRTKAFRAGFCIAQQLVEHIPMTHMDCYMHAVVTDCDSFIIL